MSIFDNNSSLKSINCDVEINGYHLHIQTEDWGEDARYIVSRVYLGGQLLKSVKTGYSEIFGKHQVSLEKKKKALKNHHSKILDLLRSTQL